MAPIADAATNADFDRIDPFDCEELERIDLREVNPFTIRVIKRSREKLEEQGKLVKIEMVPLGDDRPVVASHAIRQALEISEDFARALHHRPERSACGGFITGSITRVAAISSRSAAVSEPS